SRNTIDAALPELLMEIAHGNLNPETFPDAEEAKLYQESTDLTRSQLDLLKAILRHQRALDGADLRDLIAQFPFPVTSVNCFGRFIAGGCDDPRKAVRYLRLCTPFFVRLRSLLEGLSNDRFRFLVIQGMSAAKEYAPEENEETADSPEDGEQDPNPTPAPAALDKEAAKLLHASVNNAHDFVGGRDAAIPTPLACVKVPELPNFATDHIAKNQQAP